MMVLSIACNVGAFESPDFALWWFGRVGEETDEESKHVGKELPPGDVAVPGVQAAPLEPTIPPLPSPRPATPPALTGVSFPSEIQGDGTPKGGWFTFTDLGGDVTRAAFSVVSATNFTGFEFDPRETLTAGDYFGGTSEFNIWCEGSQTVTLQVTLFDEAGTGSNSLDFTFTCKE